MRDWDMKKALEAYCGSGFPYVCDGQKVTRDDGSCECECGSSTVTPEEYAEARSGFDSRVAPK